jgi:hypothetical protein
MDMFPTSEPNAPAGPRETQGGEAKSAEPEQPATVEVVFPHDHG